MLYISIILSILPSFLIQEISKVQIGGIYAAINSDVYIILLSAFFGAYSKLMRRSPKRKIVSKKAIR
jgi:hypothetical protein